MALIHAFLGPLWLAFALSLGASLFARWHRLPAWLQRALPLSGLSLAYQIGWARIHQQYWPTWPPLDSSHWLLWLLWPATLLALLQLRSPKSIWLNAAFSLLALALIWLIASPLRQHSWQGHTGWLIMGSAAAVWLVLIWGHKALKPSEAGVSLPWTRWSWWLLALASGWFCLLGSSAVLAQQSLLVAAALLGAVLLKPSADGHGEQLLLLYLIPGLWLQLLLFAELPPAAVLALALPLLSAVLEPHLKAQARWRQGLWLLLFSGLWLGGVAGLSWWLIPNPALYLG